MIRRDLTKAVAEGRVGALVDIVAVWSDTIQPVEIRLWDGRTINGIRCLDGKTPDIVCEDIDELFDGREIKPFVEALLANEAPFVTEVGEGDGACTIIWAIE